MHKTRLVTRQITICESIKYKNKDPQNLLFRTGVGKKYLTF